MPSRNLVLAAAAALVLLVVAGVALVEGSAEPPPPPPTPAPAPRAAPSPKPTPPPVPAPRKPLPADLGLSQADYQDTPEREAHWNALDDQLHDLAAQPWDARDEAQWLELSAELSDQVDAAEALPCDEKLAHLGTWLELLIQSGRAAENANTVGREYGSIDGRNVNLRWYRAASILQDEGLGLMRDDAAAEVVEYVRSKIGGGEFPELGLCEPFEYGPIVRP